MPRPKGSKNKVKEVENLVVTEDEGLLSRQTELSNVLDWMTANKFQDKGQIEVALSRVNLSLR